MLIWVIALVIVLVLCWVVDQYPREVKENKSTQTMEQEFKNLNEYEIHSFGKNKLSKEIEDFGHSLINGDYPVDEHKTLYIKKKEYIDAK